MILPDKEFLDKFKSVNGALSVTESIAIMNIAAMSPPGLWCEGGTHKGKSAMSAVYGANQPVDFHLIDTEFEKEIPTSVVSENIGAVSRHGCRLAFIIGKFDDYIRNTDYMFSFIFSDAGIHDDTVMEECKLLEDRLVKEGIICFHDYKNQFTAVERAYHYLLSTGKFEEIEINWQPIIEYVRQGDLEANNNSWHIYEENPFPNFVGALRRK